MKKFVLMGLCTILCFQITACSGSDQAASKQTSTGEDSRQTTEGSNDSAASAKADNNASSEKEDNGTSSGISDKLESGELLIDGVKHTFPSPVTDWTENGWHISNNYANTDTFELGNNEEVTEFEVFNDEKSSLYVSMRVINLESEPAKIEESTVSYLSTKVLDGKNELEVVLPGGINAKSTKEDVINAYGAPQEEDDDDLYYFYTTGDGLDIVVELSIAGDKVARVSYALADSNWGSVENAEECMQYINDALKTSFYGEFDNYVENKFDTAEGAQALYDSEVDYYAQNLMYFLQVDIETVDEDIRNGFYDVSKAVLAKFKWDDPVVDLEEGARWGSFEIAMYPTDFIDIIMDDVQAVADSGLEGDEYAQGMLDAVSAKVDEISYREPIIKTYDIDLDDNIVSQDDWDEIDDILMDFTEE